MAKIMYPLNTQVISFTLLDASKAVVTGAAAVADLKDGLGADVANCTNVTLTEPDPTNAPGVYTATISASFNPPLATNYVMQVTATKSGAQYFGKTPVTVADRVIA